MSGAGAGAGSEENMLQTLEKNIALTARILARYDANRSAAIRRGRTDRVALWDRHIARERAHLERLESMRAGER